MRGQLLRTRMTKRRRGTACQSRLLAYLSSLSTGCKRRRTCSSTQSNGLDHVCGPPYAAIDEQLELLVRETQPPSRLQLSCHLDKDLDTRPSEVELATAVVRKHNSCQPSIIGFQSILIGGESAKSYQADDATPTSQDCTPFRINGTERSRQTFQPSLGGKTILPTPGDALKPVQVLP